MAIRLLYSYLLSCLVSPFFAWGQCQIGLSAFSSKRSEKSLLASSGNYLVDQQFARQLNMISSTFGVRTGFFFNDDSDQANAYASPIVIVPGTVATVVFGLRMTVEQFQRTGQAQNFTIPAIIAHEFTHVVQFQRNSQLPTMGRELQADYMAGWWISRAFNYPGGAEAAAQSLAEFFELGDYDFSNPDHHGTGQERQAALLAGMRSGKLSFDSAYSISNRSFANVGNSNQSTNSSSVSKKSDSIDDELESGTDDDLKHVILLAERDSLKSIRGERDRDLDSTWKATVSVLGFRACTINEDEDTGRRSLSYTCTERFKTAEAAEKRATSLMTSIETLPGIKARSPSESASDHSQRYITRGGSLLAIHYTIGDHRSYRAALYIMPPDRN